jgi:hypothetical protein
LDHHLRDHGQPKIFIFQNEAELIGSLIRGWGEMVLPGVQGNALGVFFLGTGKNNAAMLAGILEERGATLPVSRVRPKSGNLFSWLDREASSELAPALRLSAGMKGLP